MVGIGNLLLRNFPAWMKRYRGKGDFICFLSSGGSDFQLSWCPGNSTQAITQYSSTEEGVWRETPELAHAGISGQLGLRKLHPVSGSAMRCLQNLGRIV